MHSCSWCQDPEGPSHTLTPFSPPSHLPCLSSFSWALLSCPLSPQPTILDLSPALSPFGNQSWVFINFDQLFPMGTYNSVCLKHIPSLCCFCFSIWLKPPFSSWWLSCWEKWLRFQDWRSPGTYGHSVLTVCVATFNTHWWPFFCLSHTAHACTFPFHCLPWYFHQLERPLLFPLLHSSDPFFTLRLKCHHLSKASSVAAAQLTIIYPLAWLEFL